MILVSNVDLSTTLQVFEEYSVLFLLEEYNYNQKHCCGSNLIVPTIKIAPYTQTQNFQTILFVLFVNNHVFSVGVSVLPFRGAPTLQSVHGEVAQRFEYLRLPVFADVEVRCVFHSHFY